MTSERSAPQCVRALRATTVLRCCSSARMWRRLANMMPLMTISTVDRNREDDVGGVAGKERSG